MRRTVDAEVCLETRRRHTAHPGRGLPACCRVWLCRAGTRRSSEVHGRLDGRITMRAARGCRLPVAVLPWPRGAVPVGRFRSDAAAAGFCRRSCSTACTAEQKLFTMYGPQQLLAFTETRGKGCGPRATINTQTRRKAYKALAPSARAGRQSRLPVQPGPTTGSSPTLIWHMHGTVHHGHAGVPGRRSQSMVRRIVSRPGSWQPETIAQPSDDDMHPCAPRDETATDPPSFMQSGATREAHRPQPHLWKIGKDLFSFCALFTAVALQPGRARETKSASMDGQEKSLSVPCCPSPAQRHVHAKGSYRGVSNFCIWPVKRCIGRGKATQRAGAAIPSQPSARKTTMREGVPSRLLLSHLCPSELHSLQEQQ